MDPEEKIAFVFFGFLFFIVLIGFLALPVTGSIAGYEIKMPIIGWIGLAALAILGLIIAVKAQFSK